MQKTLRLYVLATAIFLTYSLISPQTLYGGERFQRFKKGAKSFYNKATKLDHTATEKERKKAKDIAGKILESAGITGARKGIEWIDKKNESSGFYDDSKRNRR